MDVVNLTPHDIRLNQVNITPGGKPIRVRQHTEVLYYVHDVPVKILRGPANDLTQLPAPKPSTIYIVSRLVADVYRNDRDDFVFPYDFIRNQDGYIDGCKSLAKFEARLGQNIRT